MTNNIENPLVSILMPIGTINKYLDKTLCSISSQTYKNFELIVACDYSIYNDLIKIISKYKFKSYIYPLHLSGISFARNVTINSSNGDFLAPWDSDDISDENRLQKQVEYLLQNPDCGIVGTRVELIDENNKIINNQKFKFFQSNKQIRDALKYRQPLFHSSMVFRRKILFKAKGYLYGHTSEDHELFIRIARDETVLFHNLNNVCTYYRRHADQLSDFSNLKKHFREVTGFMFSEFLRTGSLYYIIGIFANLPIFRRIRHFLRSI